MDENDQISEEKIKQLQAELARLTKLVYYDELTGLFNRRGFLEEAERAFHLVSYGNSTVERRTGFQIPFSVIFADVDNFKNINDTHGHAAGDKALKTIAQAMHHSLRTGDLFGRFGGEEFVVALIGASAKRAALIAEKLRHAVEAASCVFNGTVIPLTASIGVAEYGDEKALLALISRADKAMYEAKQQGKNRVVTAGEE